MWVLYSFGLIFAAGLGALAAVEITKKRQRRKLAESKAQQRDQREALLTIINGTSQAIFTVSGSGIIRVYNAALLSLLDTNQSLSGKKVDDVLTLHDKKNEPVSLLQLMRASAHFERDDLSLRFPDGDEIVLHLSVNKIQSAFSARRQVSDEGYVCIARDITRQKSLDEERDEFISVVSHELRTPVTITEGVLSNLQLFIEKGASPAKVSGALEDAHEQVVMLSRMINDLGTLSRAERGVGDQLEVIDVQELISELFRKYQKSASKKGLSLNLDAGSKLGSIETSRLYLEEILQNIIVNAIKYTEKGSVTLGAHRVKGGIEFFIKDTGIGISKTDIKHVFEKFYRSEDYRTRETSGTGLGLYVVSKLMRKLGTTVTITSRLNHGSVFRFVLPDKLAK